MYMRMLFTTLEWMQCKLKLLHVHSREGQCLRRVMTSVDACHMHTLHSGAASGLRTLLAKVIISAAVLELEPP